MAITILKKPFSINPAFNDLWIKASSTNTAQPDFSYYITTTIGADVFIDRVKPDAAGNCYFNAKKYAEKYVSNEYPFGLDGWNALTTAYANLSIDVGEEYSGTTYSGTTVAFKVWNAALTKRERASYLPTDYDNTTTAPVWLNNFEPGTERIKVSGSQDVPIFFLKGQGVTLAYFDVYDSSGTLLNSFSLGNSNSEVVCLNAGAASIKRLLIASPGSFSLAPIGPPFPATASYYRVTFSNTTGSTQKYFEIDPYCGKYYNKTLFYLNRFGAYDFINMYGNHKKDNNVVRTTYKRMASVSNFQQSHIDGSTDTLIDQPLDLNERAQNIIYRTTHTLESNWLTDIQRIQLSDLPSSPDVFLDLGDLDYQRLNAEDTKYHFTTPLIDKLVNLKVMVSEDWERRQNA